MLCIAPQLVFVSRTVDGSQTNRRENSNSGSFKVMHLGVGITEKPTTDCVSPYNNAGLIVKVCEEIASENAENCHSQQLHCRLTPPPRGTSTNNRINLIQPETKRHWPTFLPMSMGLSFIPIFVARTETRVFSATECVTAVSAVQGHPRSLILAPVERAYATSY